VRWFGEFVGREHPSVAKCGALRSSVGLLGAPPSNDRSSLRSCSGRRRWAIVRLRRPWRRRAAAQQRRAVQPSHSNMGEPSADGRATIHRSYSSRPWHAFHLRRVGRARQTPQHHGMFRTCSGQVGVPPANVGAAVVCGRGRNWSFFVCLRRL